MQYRGRRAAYHEASEAASSLYLGYCALLLLRKITRMHVPAYFLSLKFNGSLSLSLSLRIFPLYKASFILAAKKFRKPIFKHMLGAA